MQATLEVTAGPCAGRKIALPVGQPVSIGRTSKADCVMDDDTFLSSAHFDVQWSGQQCHVHDLNSSNGTFLNGARVSESPVREGDVLTAGQSSFALKLTEPEPMTTLYTAVRLDETRAIPIPAYPAAAASAPGAPSGPSLSPVQQALIDVLAGLADNLYAVVDLSLAKPFLSEVAIDKIELLSGDAGLIAVSTESRLARQLAASGWGAGWGFYATSHQSATIVRNHLKRFQTVLTSDGAELQFRFFKPELLRSFLPTLSAGEAKTFFGPLTSILIEGASADELLLYIPGPSGVLEKKIPLRCD